MKNKLDKLDNWLNESRFAREDFMHDKLHAHGPHHHFGGQRNRKSNQNGVETFTSGLIFTVAFGLAWYLTGWWIWLFPFIFAGILPLVEGVRKMIHERSMRKADRLNQKTTARDTNVLAEKEILRIAKAEQGRVTPTMIALNSSLSVEEAEKILEDMVKKGYASMRVTNSGRIEYEFPEFLPAPEDHPFE